MNLERILTDGEEIHCNPVRRRAWAWLPFMFGRTHWSLSWMDSDLENILRLLFTHAESTNASMSFFSFWFNKAEEVVYNFPFGLRKKNCWVYVALTALKLTQVPSSTLEVNKFFLPWFLNVSVLAHECLHLICLTDLAEPMKARRCFNFNWPKLVLKDRGSGQNRQYFEELQSESCLIWSRVELFILFAETPI